MQSIKCVIVGDVSVGKTCLLLACTSNSFLENYKTTMFESYCVNVIMDGNPISLTLWEIAGQEDYSKFLPVSFPQTDVFLVLYSVTDPKSFYNVEEKWVPELRSHAPNVPIVLVGTKIDEREDPKSFKKLGQTPITTEQGKLLADKLNLTFCEVSALNQKSVEATFTSAIHLVREKYELSKNAKKKFFQKLITKSCKND